MASEGRSRRVVVQRRALLTAHTHAHRTVRDVVRGTTDAVQLFESLRARARARGERKQPRARRQTCAATASDRARRAYESSLDVDVDVDDAALVVDVVPLAAAAE